MKTPWIFAAFPLTFGLLGCGYPAFTWNEGAGGAGGNSTSGTGGASTTTGGMGGTDSGTTTGTGGAGGAGGSSTSGTGGTGGMGTGGSPPVCNVVHPGGGSCEYLPGQACGCPTNQKCSVTDETSGASSCILYNVNAAAFSKCTSDGDCNVGHWCDKTKSLCRPICISSGDCPSGAQCLEAISPGTKQPIPGLKVCTSHCNPMNGSPCSSEFTCVYSSSILEWDCTLSGAQGVGVSCASSADCKAGLACVGSNNNYKCERWCHPANDAFSVYCAQFINGKNNCVKLSVPYPYNGDSYGACL